jgi:VWFA-related protein
MTRAALLALIPAILAAQPAVFTTDVKVVSLFATVRDAQGHVVPNLTKDDFTLEEDGRPQTIGYFAAESGLPLTIGLLVDTSISQKKLLAEERTASLKFLMQVLRPDTDRAFVIHFDREVELLADLTSSREALDQALARLQTPTLPARKRGAPKLGAWTLGGTALYDAVLLSSDDLMRKQSGRKALVLLTDGVDNGSKIGLFDAIRAAQFSDTAVYSVLFADRDAYDGTFAAAAGKKALERISHDTGGAFFEVTHDRAIAAIYGQLEEELRTQYSLGYTSDRTSNASEYRKIHLSTKPGLAVATRDGYYAGGR